MARTVNKAVFDANFEVEVSLAKSTLGDTIITHKGSHFVKLTSSTTPDLENVWGNTVALAAGSGSLDLGTGALTDEEGNAIATAGKRVRAMYIEGTSTNTAAVVISKAASEGSTLFGSAGQLAVYPGAKYFLYFGGSTTIPDITDNTDDKFDLTGTGTESIKVILIIG